MEYQFNKQQTNSRKCSVIFGWFYSKTHITPHETNSRYVRTAYFPTMFHLILLLYSIPTVVSMKVLVGYRYGFEINFSNELKPNCIHQHQEP